MQYTFTTHEMAALFTMFEQPVPPNVAEDLSHVSGGASHNALSAAVDSLVNKGALIAEPEGKTALENGLAEMLGICFHADAAVATDEAGKTGPVLYAYGPSVVSVSKQGDHFEMIRSDDPCAGSAVVQRALSAGAGLVDAEKYCVTMTMKEFDRLLGCLGGRGRKLDEMCASHGWDCDVVVEIMDRVTEGAALRFVTTRPGVSVEMDTRIDHADGVVWLVKVTIVEKGGWAVLARTDAMEVYSIVTDFGEALA